MVNIILSSHGGLAVGVLDSSKMIFGDQDNVVAIEFKRTDNAEGLAKKFQAQLKKFKNKDETLFMVDLWGGTPFNQASQIIAQNKGKMALVAGLNLPMLIETFGTRMGGETSAEKLAAAAVKPGVEGIRVFPESAMPTVKRPKAAAEDKKSSSGAVNLAKVPGGKGLDLRLVRIDSRLLHGQVATAWTKDANPQRIIIVSDAVSKDELRKSLLVSAAPSGVKVNVIPLKKLIDIWDDKRFEGLRTMLLFENPEDIDTVVKDGVGIKQVNVGSMAFTNGKKMIDGVNAVDSKDVAAFDDLKKRGVDFNVRKVPSDRSEDLFGLIKKADLSATKGN
jgi:PTS system mannose-specific IIB component